MSQQQQQIIIVNFSKDLRYIVTYTIYLSIYFYFAKFSIDPENVILTFPSAGFINHRSISDVMIIYSEQLETCCLFVDNLY